MEAAARSLRAKLDRYRSWWPLLLLLPLALEVTLLQESSILSGLALAITVEWELPQEWNFSACSFRSACGPAGSRWHFLQDLLPPIYGTMFRSGHKGQPVILQVGSCNLDNATRFEGLSLIQMVIAQLSDTFRSRVRVVCVDQITEHEEMFWQQLQGLPIQQKGSRFISAVLADKCPSAGTYVCRLSRNVERDFGIPFSHYESWRGDSPMGLYYVLLDQTSRPGLDPELKAKWQKLLHTWNLPSYAEEDTLPCLTISTLLERIGLAGQGFLLSAVILRADINVVDSVVDVPLFNPAFLLYEPVPWQSVENRALVAKLQSRGFAVGRSYGKEVHGKGVAVPAATISPPTPDRAMVAAREVAAEVKPQFSACYFASPCGPSAVRWRYLQDVLGSVAQTATDVADQGQLPTVLHIGSSDLGGFLLFADVELHKRTLTTLPLQLRAKVRYVFVDPNLEHGTRIWSRIRMLPIHSGHAQFIQGMVTDVCPGDRVSMYRLSQQAERDFGVPWLIYQTWLGPSKQHVKNVFLGWVKGQGLVGKYGPNWAAFDKAGNYTAYMEEVPVPCFTVSSLLAKINIAVGSLAMVVVDAESADYKIVQSMLDLQSFKPGFLQFEMSEYWDGPSNQALVQRLTNQGFTVGRTYEEVGTDANNVIAIPTRVEPQFSACTTPLPCGPAGSQWRYWGDLLQSVVASAREVAKRGKAPVAVQMGDCISKTLLHFRLILSHLLPEDLQPVLRFICVDPDRTHQQLFWEQSQSLPLGSRVQFVNGEVLDKCTSEHPRAGVVFPQELPAQNLSAPEVPVPCFTVSALLARMVTTVANLAMVSINGGSPSSQVVGSLLHYLSFNPGLLAFAVLWDSAEHQALVSRLASRGFEVGRMYSQPHGTSMAVAVQR